MVKKKQKVRFHKGDRRPGKLDGKLSYTTEMEKVGRKDIVECQRTLQIIL